MWGAVGGAVVNNNTQYETVVSVHHSVHNTGFASLAITYNPNSPEKNAKEIDQAVLQTFHKFSIEHPFEFSRANFLSNTCASFWVLGSLFLSSRK